MYIYSVTVSVDKSVANDWLIWTRSQHIPRIMATGCFHNFSVKELLEPTVHEGMLTYNVQYLADTMEHIRTYMAEHAQGIHSVHDERYRGRYTAFDSLLKSV